MAKNREFRITWEVADGYVGQSRPQYTDIAPGEVDEDMDLDDAIKVIEDAIQSDFEQNIAPSYGQDEVRELAEKLLAKAKESEA